MVSNKHLNFLARVDRCIVPNQNDWPRDLMQQPSQEFNHLFAGHSPLMQFDSQSYPTGFRADQQGTDQIGPLMMVKAGPHRWGLAARGPSALERADQRFTTFIKENQGCAQALPLFLSRANDSVSNRQFQPHPVARPTVVASDNSS
jgi:hypothetical protein